MSPAIAVSTWCTFPEFYLAYADTSLELFGEVNKILVMQHEYGQNRSCYFSSFLKCGSSEV